MNESIKEETGGVAHINDSVTHLKEITKENVEIATSSSKISEEVKHIASNILEDSKHV